MSNPHPNKPIKTASLRTTKTPIHQEDGHDFAKDLREAGLVYAFSKCCPDVEIRDFQQLDDSNGAPDFQIVVAEERIGLEVTNYVRPKELRLEAACERYLARAENIFGLSYPDLALEVTVTWNTALSIGKLYQHGSESVLSAFVGNHIPALGKWMEYAGEVLPAQLQELICDLRICRLSGNASSSHWHFWSTCWTPKLTVENLAQLIESKNAKLARYHQFFERVWLLITPHARGASSMFEIPQEVTSHIYESSFDRVYLMNSSCTQACQLIIRQIKTGCDPLADDRVSPSAMREV